MCNLSDGILEAGINKGMEQGRESIVCPSKPDQTYGLVDGKGHVRAGDSGRGTRNVCCAFGTI